MAADQATGKLDFDGMNQAYDQFFGTQQQPNKPTRATVQVAALVAPWGLVGDRSSCRALKRSSCRALKIGHAFECFPQRFRQSAFTRTETSGAGTICGSEKNRLLFTTFGGIQP